MTNNTKATKQTIITILFFLIPLLVLFAFIIQPRKDPIKEKTLTYLNSLLKSDSVRQVRGAAARSLGKIGDPDSVRILLDAYEADDLILDDVVQALADLGVKPTDVYLEHIVTPYIGPTILEKNRDWLLKHFDFWGYIFTVVIVTAIINILAVLSIYVHKKFRFKATEFQPPLIEVFRKYADITGKSFTFLVFVFVIAYFVITNIPKQSVKPVSTLTEIAIIELVRKTKDEKAVPWLINILDNPNRSTEARWRAAHALGAIGTSSAIPALEKALENGDFKVRLYTAWAIGNILSRDDLREAEFNQTEMNAQFVQQLTEYLMQKPNSAAVYLLRGRTYTDLGRYYDALNDFDKAIVLSPQFNTDAYTDRGYVFSMLDMLDKAISDYDHAINLNANFSLAYFRRGLAFTALLDFNRAIEDFSKVIEIDPTSTQAYLQRGNIYHRLEQFEESLRDYQKYLELDPNTLDSEEVKKRIEILKNKIP